MRPVSTLVVAVLGTGALALPLIAGAPAMASDRGVVRGAVASWTRQAPVVGAPSAAAKISFSIVLPMRDQAAAERVAASVSDPASADYGRYLTAAQFNARFAPTAGQVAAVRSFLSSRGLTVTGVAQGNGWINATGTTRQVEKAFSTTLKTYSWHGRQLRAPAATITVPLSVASDIAAVSGLDEAALLRQPNTRRVVGTAPVTATTVPGRARPNATPPSGSTCSTYWDQNEQTVPSAYGRTRFPTYVCGYAPAALRGAYGVQSKVSAGDTGAGVTVAVIDAYGSPTIKSDANFYSSYYGEPGFGANQYTQTLFTPFGLQTQCGGEAGWNQEEALDVEAVHGLAPGANIHYFGAADCGSGLDNALNYVVQNHLADIVSNSWGSVGEGQSAAEIAKEHAIFVQAAAEGIGMYFSSGDGGDNTQFPGGTVQPEPDYPASDPDVTAVGGTSLGIGSANNYLFETGWGSMEDDIDYSGSTARYVSPLPGTFKYGAGGGTSRLFTAPDYQTSRVPTSLSMLHGATPMRVVPDVSAVADPYTGYSVIETINGQLSITTIGGTSLACPVFAGIQALASQGRPAPIGFANPLLYRASFGYHDVRPSQPTAVASPTAGYLLTFDKDTSLTTTEGYDGVTGLGSPNGPGLLKAETGGAAPAPGRGAGPPVAGPPAPGRGAGPPITGPGPQPVSGRNVAR